MSKSIVKVNVVRAVAEGTVRFGDVEAQCAVLADCTALISKRGVVSIITGRAAEQSGSIERFIDRLPGDNSKLADEATHCRSLSGSQVMHGITANCLVDILSAYADALIEGKLHHSQVAIGKRCAKLLQAMAKTTATVMVYEATGFVQTKSPLRQMMEADRSEALLLDTPKEYTVHYPKAFFAAHRRLYGFKCDTARPHTTVRFFLATYVYAYLDPTVYAELRLRNPTPDWKLRHHQLFTIDAARALRAHIHTLTAVMVASPDKESFKAAFAAVFNKTLALN